jgi:hypothetical protein
MKRFLLSFLLFASAFSVVRVEGFQEETLLGNWECVEGSCSWEEIAFTIEGENRVFKSWLHSRPAAMDGNWNIADGFLTVECCAGLSWNWKILEIGHNILRLMENGSKEETALRRIHD